ncbi:MAG: MarR family winged helix-turn-helix transcriptional regulator [Pseudomonadota bacterium]
MVGKPRYDIDFRDFVNIDLNRAMRSLRDAFQVRALNETGLNLQEWRALLNLARFGDSHLRELARLDSLDAAHTGRAVLELEKKGLIRRQDDAADSRRKRLAVTPQGHAVVDEVWAKARALDEDVKLRVGKTRHKALKESLALILEMEAEQEPLCEIAAE